MLFLGKTTIISTPDDTFAPKPNKDMRRVFVVLILMGVTFWQLGAQEEYAEEAIMAILGVVDIEEVDQYEVERLYALIERPLELNHSTASRLVSTGLFSAYQAASLIDYRIRHGDILSFGELSMLDGFSQEYVRLLMPFLDLSSGTLPSVVSTGVRNELRVRSGTSLSDGGSWNYGMKYTLESSSGVSAGLGLSRPSASSDILPKSLSANIVYEARKVPLRVVAGDFNARFGQGLAFWNGMSMSGLSIPSTFLRRASGYSASSSFTGNYALMGVASSVTFRHLVLNASLAVPGLKTVRAAPEKVSLLPLLNLTWNRRHGQIGFTHYLEFQDKVADMKSSFDMAWCIRGIDIFGEVSYDWVGRVAAALAGTVFPLGESFRVATMLRLYPSAYTSGRSGAQRSTTKCSNEYSFTLAGEYLSPDRVHSASLSTDVAYFPEPKSKTTEDDWQVKVAGDWKWTHESVTLKARLTERIRSWGLPTRTDVRLEASIPVSDFVFNIRTNLLHSRSLAGLVYLEGGYKTSVLAGYLRLGAFIVDNWDDRIYVYERDAPGGFNVPAMYGRGVWTAGTLSWKPHRWVKVYARGALTAYPFMHGQKKKPGKAELKLHCVFSF